MSPQQGVLTPVTRSGRALSSRCRQGHMSLMCAMMVSSPPSVTFQQRVICSFWSYSGLPGQLRAEADTQQPADR